MSRAWSQKRARLFDAAGGQKKNLVGRDMKRTRRQKRSNRIAWLPIFVGVVAAALFLVALRNSILRVRYDLDAARQRETALMERKATATVRLRELRDPTRLKALAKERDFVRPDKVIDLGTGAVRP
ncbi:MAG: hypothetical protein GY723_00265 [bacterium]|nr:hypothetical protein [bacterium]MCP5070443.1 hypothetical protein [bacterium]